MFIIGLILGATIGATIGLFLGCALRVGRRADDDMQRLADAVLSGEAK